LRNTRYGRMIAAALLTLMSLGTVAAAASSAEMPFSLSDGHPVGSALTGSAAGAFDYYALTYPGDESVVTIELRFVPGDPVTSSAVGFNVYGPSGYVIGQGLPVEDTGGDGLLQLDYSDSNPATWLIQVYNYLPDLPVNYTIWVEGLSEVVEQAPEQPATAPEPETEVALLAPTRSTLVGSPAGAFDLFTIDYPGDDSLASIELWFVPADPVTSAAVGFNVYLPDGRSLGQGAACQDTGGDGLLRLDYSDYDPTTLHVQVFNYLDGAPLYYVLSSALTME